MQLNLEIPEKDLQEKYINDRLSEKDTDLPLSG